MAATVSFVQIYAKASKCVDMFSCFMHAQRPFSLRDSPHFKDKILWAQLKPKWNHKSDKIRKHESDKTQRMRETSTVTI